MELRATYETERATAFQTYLASPEGQEKYKLAYPTLLVFYKVMEPERQHEAAHQATLARIERLDFLFPEYADWFQTKYRATTVTSA